MHKKPVLFLCSLTIPVLGWYHSGHALEHFCKIIGIIIPYLHTHVLDAYAPVLQQFFGLVYPETGEVGGEILVKALFEQLAEIGV